MRMVILVLVGLLAAFAFPVRAQDAAPVGVWQKEFKLGLNILQSSYSENWNGGDKGSVVWNGAFEGRMEKQYGQSRNWRHSLKLSYGQTHQQDRDAGGDLYWRRPDKTDDIIDYESLLRFTQDSGWDPFVALGLR
ncbi:MAG: DUF3078 domain-containing protein, partial [Candidatus Krumholzibacteriia bacterium]